MACQFTIAKLLAAIALFAVSLVALVNVSLWWASVYLTSTVGLLIVAILVVLCRRGDDRYFWLGFSILGWGYLLLVYGPGLDRHIGHRLFTTKVLAYSQQRIQRSPNMSEQDSVQVALSPLDNPLMWTMTETGVYYYTPPQWAHFQQIGHSLVVIVISLFGGVLSRYLYATRDQRRGAG